MPKLQRERGATAILVALLMVGLVGFAAIAVDIGAAWADKKQLQNGADASALAIAQQCAVGACPASPDVVADSWAKKNKVGSTATAYGDVVRFETGLVRTRAYEDLTHWFAPVIGIEQSRIVAEAQAEWGTPRTAGGIPLAFNFCTWEALTGGEPESEADAKELQIALLETGNQSGAPPTSCLAEHPNFFVTGGFNWLDTGGTVCSAEMNADSYWQAGSDPGGAPPNGCKNETQLAVLRTGEPILVPIFDAFTGTGQNAQYHIKSFASFIVTAYDFKASGRQWREELGLCQVAVANKTLDIKANECPNNWIQGKFLRYVKLADGLKPDPGLQNLGATIVALTD